MKDIQKSQSPVNIPLKKVGIRNFEYPIKIISKNGGFHHVAAKFEISVNLLPNIKGTHMSRLVDSITKHFSEDFDLRNTRYILKDLISHLEVKKAQINVKFPIFIKKIAPISKQESLLCVQAGFNLIKCKNNYQKIIFIRVPVTTLCPCSKEISKNGAHNQRSYVTLYVISEEFIWFEDYVKLIEKRASCEIYPLLKREDEKNVTETAYDNPVFVEDIVRLLASDLHKIKSVKYFKIIAENMESIHSHNAFASYSWGNKNE